MTALPPRWVLHITEPDPDMPHFPATRTRFIDFHGSEAVAMAVEYRVRTLHPHSVISLTRAKA